MIVILGLVILVAALAAGAAGVLAHAGHAHAALLAQSRRETAAVSQQRDDLISQRDTARAYTVLDEQRNYTASTFGDGDGDGDGKLVLGRRGLNFCLRRSSCRFAHATKPAKALALLSWFMAANAASTIAAKAARS
jgi:hypothetical protein